MLDKHKTQDGHTILIAQMSPEHLVNMIRLILKEIVERQLGAQSDELNDYQRTLYNIPKQDLATVAHSNRLAFKRLEPYLAEAFLRGGADFDQVREELQEALGRTGQIGGTDYYSRGNEVQLLEDGLAAPAATFVDLDDDPPF